MERDENEERFLDDDAEAEPSGDQTTGHRVAEALRKAVTAGMETLLTSEESLRGAVSDLKLPKEAMFQFFNQAERTKADVTRVLGRELRTFLESLDVRRIARKALEGMIVEVHAEVRFRADDGLPGVMPEMKLVTATHHEGPGRKPRAKLRKPKGRPRPKAK